MRTNSLDTYLHTMSAAGLADASEDGGAHRRKLEFWPPLGTIQGRIVALDGIASPEGMPVGDIAQMANGPGGPSTEIVLDTLDRRGIVERMTGDRYRLASEYRRLAALARAEAAAPEQRRSHA